MDPVVSPIIVGLAVTVVGGIIVAYVKKQWNKIDSEKARVANVEARLKKSENDVWKLKKFAVIQAKLMDDQTAKNHPELTTNLEDIANELLKNSDNS